MDNVKTADYYLHKVIDDIDFCIRHSNDMELDDFCNDEVLSSAISFKFVQISENVKKLPGYLYDLYPYIPWKKISGLRNRIVHDYGSVQLDIIFNTIKNDLPTLLLELEKIIEESAKK